MNKYTIKDFRAEFPTEKSCLDYIFAQKHPDKVKTHYYVAGRKCYADSKGKQIHPVAGTVFEKSSTPLTLWFFAIYLFSVSRNGVSAMELQRQLGVTYKCAWRMAKQIRALMTQGDGKFSGIVEVDETFIGGHHNQANKFKKKSVVFGIAERGANDIKAFVVRSRKGSTLLKKIKDNVEKGTRIHSDEFDPYHRTWNMGYSHYSVNHSRREYVRGKIHTNTIEGFWGQFKTSLRGTYHAVSKKYLQSYVNEFAFRRNVRPAVFAAMMARI